MCCDHVKVSAQVLFVREYSALHGPCDVRRLANEQVSFNCAKLLFCFSSVWVEIVLVNTSAPGFCFHGLRHRTLGGLPLLCTFYSRCCWTSWYRVCVRACTSACAFSRTLKAFAKGVQLHSVRLELSELLCHKGWMKEPHIRASRRKGNIYGARGAQLTALLRHNIHNPWPSDAFLQLVY